MYVIVVYDVNNERCLEIMKILRKYLFHRQNSVFEGALTHSLLTKLKNELEKKINQNEDEIIFYELLSNKYLYTSNIGKKRRISQIL